MFGQADPGPGAEHQLDAQGQFKLADCLGDGWLGHTKTAGRLADRAGGDNAIEIFQLANGDLQRHAASPGPGSPRSIGNNYQEKEKFIYSIGAAHATLLQSAVSAIATKQNEMTGEAS